MSTYYKRVTAGEPPRFTAYDKHRRTLAWRLGRHFRADWVMPTLSSTLVPISAAEAAELYHAGTTIVLSDQQTELKPGVSLTWAELSLMDWSEVGLFTWSDIGD